MRKLSITLLLVFFVITTQAQQKKTLVASASMMADMAENIAKGLVEVKYIVPRGQDPHLYKPTPSDVVMVQKADLIIINGLTFEGWIAKLIANSGTNAPTITITEGIKPIQSEKYANSYDPHAWMDVNLALTYIENIKNALIALLPEHQETFTNNYEEYRRQLVELDQYIMEAIQKIPEKRRILITSHDAFAYYGKRYGLRLEAIMGISTESDVQSSDIIRVHKAINENEVPAIFMESTINPKILQQIAKDNKIKIGGELFADSLGDKNSPAATYINMLKHNTDTIVKGLTGDVLEEYNPEEISRIRPIYLYAALIGIFVLIALGILRKLNKL